MSVNGESVLVVGAGISGLSAARMLQAQGKTVTVSEKESTPGGLVRCERIDGVLYHCVGGHVFNSRKQVVLDWFWKQFNKDDFTLAIRHAVVSLESGHIVDYPIENHLYQMTDSMRSAVLDDLLSIASGGYPKASNFDDFLRYQFGQTLYREYFAPYNHKIWRRSLSDIPLSWLEGKLPMPTVKEILSANIAQEKEMNMVHSTFHYPTYGGSQHIADTLAQGLNILYNTPVTSICRVGDKWKVNDAFYDSVVYCANIKELPHLLQNVDVDLKSVEKLEAHGTTSVLCEIESNPYSWIYMPSGQHESHRIICTGNFADSNSPAGISTATVEFTIPLSKEEIIEQLQIIPFRPR